MTFRERWFRDGTAGWSPLAYEWYFTRTPVGAVIRRAEQAAVVSCLHGILRPEQRVLEIGPGTGNYTTLLARRCAGVVAVDPSPGMCDYLRQRLAAENITNVEVCAGALPCHLDVAGPFDGVLTIGVLNYVPAVSDALRTLGSCLAPGGWAIVTLPLHTPEGRFYALTEAASRRQVPTYTPKAALALARSAGLRVERMFTAGITRAGLTLVVQCRGDETA